jgi:hypothetical protein
VPALDDLHPWLVVVAPVGAASAAAPPPVLIAAPPVRQDDRPYAVVGHRPAGVVDRHEVVALARVAGRAVRVVGAQEAESPRRQEEGAGHRVPVAQGGVAPSSHRHEEAGGDHRLQGVGQIGMGIPRPAEAVGDAAHGQGTALHRGEHLENRVTGVRMQTAHFNGFASPVAASRPHLTRSA